MPGLYFTVLVCSVLALGWAQRLPTPIGITIPARTLTMVRVNWKQPPSIKYTKFGVKISPRATILPPERPDDTSRTFEDLQPGIAYTVTLRGETADRRRSRPLRFHIWSEPRQPRSLKLTPIREVKLAVKLGDYEDTYSAPVVGLHVDWEAPEGRTGLNGYDVRIEPKEDCAMLNPQPNKDEEPDHTSRIFAGLTPGQQYTISVRTKTGPLYDLVYSTPITATAIIPPATPYTVEVTDVGATHASVNTLGPLKGIFDKLEFVLDPEHGVVGPPSLDPIYNRFNVYTFTGLQPSTKYVLKVYSVSKGVRSWEPYTVEINTKPAAPMLLQVTAYGQDFVTLQWDQPATFTTSDEIEYLIGYVDIEDATSGQTGTTRVRSGDFLVNVKVQQLIPGVTYKFTVYTQKPGELPVLQAETVQTTIPPKPRITTLDPTNGGIIVVYDSPSVGKCPELKVSVSPNPESKPPGYHFIGQEIYLPNVPREERFTIHSRCVSNYLEGPELVVSSRAVVDPETGKVGDPPNLPRRALPCILARTGRRVPRPDVVTPDSCCGNRPYNKANQQCCGEILAREGDNRLCCHQTFYFATSSVCCSGGLVRPKEDGCEDFYVR